MNPIKHSNIRNGVRIFPESLNLWSYGHIYIPRNYDISILYVPMPSTIQDIKGIMCGIDDADIYISGEDREFWGGKVIIFRSLPYTATETFKEYLEGIRKKIVDLEMNRQAKRNIKL